MSVNAFYQSMGGIQNALGDPRGDAERRAIQQRQMQIQEMEFAARQQDAQRVAQQRQAEQARQQAVFGFRGGSMYPNGQRPAPMPQGGQMSAPQMAGPMPQAITAQPVAGQPQQIAGPMATPQAPQMDAQGREIEMVTVTGERRGPTPTQEDELDFLMRDAYKRNDVDGFNQYFEARRSNMSAQEKAGRQQIAIAAGEVIDLPTHEARVAAVRQFMANNNINPEDTKIDDYFNDPDALMFELEMAIGLGAPDKSAEANVGVRADRQKQINEQQFAPASALNLGNRQLIYGGAGNEIASYDVGVNPTQARGQDIGATTQRRGQDVSSSTQIRGQNITAATARRGQNMTDARASRQQKSSLPSGFILNGN